MFEIAKKSCHFYKNNTRFTHVILAFLKNNTHVSRVIPGEAIFS